MIDDLKEISQRAGAEIMKIYQTGDVQVDYKSDKSPVTAADMASHHVVVSGLKKIANFPIVSEEDPVDYSTRKDWSQYWLVDPLDGTKDFLKRNGEFTVNIALIKENSPVLGVVLVPTSGDLYWAQTQSGAFKNDQQIQNTRHNKDNFIAVESRSHTQESNKEFYKNNNITTIKKYGSSIKLCKLAEGELDVYPRLAPTSEWDTAAAHAILNEANCTIIDVVQKSELSYNKPNILNNFFIATRKNIHWKY